MPTVGELTSFGTGVKPSPVSDCATIPPAAITPPAEDARKIKSFRVLKNPPMQSAWLSVSCTTPIGWLVLSIATRTPK